MYNKTSSHTGFQSYSNEDNLDYNRFYRETSTFCAIINEIVKCALPFKQNNILSLENSSLKFTFNFAYAATVQAHISYQNRRKWNAHG